MRVITGCEKGKQFADKQRKDTKDNKTAGQELTSTAMERQSLYCAAYTLKDTNYVREEARP
jgi:cell division protein FtsB